MKKESSATRTASSVGGGYARRPVKFYGIPHFASPLHSSQQNYSVFTIHPGELWRSKKGQPNERSRVRQQRVIGGSGNFGWSLKTVLRSLRFRCPSDDSSGAQCRSLEVPRSTGLRRCGRFEAYIEQGISLWDVAAGWSLSRTRRTVNALRPT